MLNICQVSLARDIPIILENYKNFKKFYKSFKIFIVCPNNEIQEFKKRLHFSEFNLINEDTIITFEVFNKIFEKLNHNVKYKDIFKKRLGWYYQQILKLSFVMEFVGLNKENIVIWDADTVILKKLNFFEGEYSIKYGTLFEFHKHYYKTNKSIIGEHPRYFISSLVQFISLSVLEYNFFYQKIINLDPDDNEEKTAPQLSKIILKNIFKTHDIYNGSLFSEYELIGISSYILRKNKQKALFTLRSGLNGKLTNLQIILARLLNVKHVTYEHSYLNRHNQGMLDRKQDWINYIKILFKGVIKFNLRNLKHNLSFYYNSINE